MKLVMVINGELPRGLIANCAAVFGISVGKLFGDIVGPDVHDKDGNLHLGITAKVIPVLNGSREQLKDIRTKAADESADMSIIDFSEIAQKCTDYDTYMAKIGNTGYDDIEYMGVCLYGPDKKVNSLTGSLPLLR